MRDKPQTRLGHLEVAARGLADLVENALDRIPGVPREEIGFVLYLFDRGPERWAIFTGNFDRGDMAALLEEAALRGRGDVPKEEEHLARVTSAWVWQGSVNLELAVEAKNARFREGDLVAVRPLPEAGEG